MVVGMLATRATLNDNLIKRFMRSIIDIAREHAKESSDPHWLRLSFMALINLVQVHERSVNSLNFYFMNSSHNWSVCLFELIDFYLINYSCSLLT